MTVELTVINNPYYGRSKTPRKVDMKWLYKKYRSVCWICRRFVPWDQASRDHIVPRSLGGGPEKSNIALAHKECNSKRGNGFREIHYRHYENIKDVREITLIEDLGIYVQVWEDRRNGGINVLVAKKSGNIS